MLTPSLLCHTGFAITREHSQGPGYLGGGVWTPLSGFQSPLGHLALREQVTWLVAARQHLGGYEGPAGGAGRL